MTDTEKLAEDVERVFSVAAEINYEDGQVTDVIGKLIALLADASEALEFAQPCVKPLRISAVDNLIAETISNLAPIVKLHKQER